MDDLCQMLEDLGNEVTRRIPSLNHGGCCVFAYLIGKQLSNLGRNVSGVVTNYSIASIDDIRPKLLKNSVDGWNKHSLYFCHVVLDLGDLWYDSRGVFPPCSVLDGYKVATGRLSLKEMKEIAGKPEGWNSMFKREHILPLSKIVVRHFSRYKNSLPFEVTV